VTIFKNLLITVTVRRPLKNYNFSKAFCLDLWWHRSYYHHRVI